MRVFGGEDEGGFAHDEVFGDGTDVAGIAGVEYLVSGDEVPVLLEGVFTDKGIAQVELALLLVYRGLGLVGDQVTIQGEVQRVDGDGRACRGNEPGTEILDVPAMPVIEGESVVLFLLVLLNH